MGNSNSNQKKKRTRKQQVKELQHYFDKSPNDIDPLNLYKTPLTKTKAINNNSTCNLRKCNCLNQTMHFLRNRNEINNVEYLVNAYHHILRTHHDEFEEMYDLLVTENNNETCKLLDCDVMRRNFRDRESLRNKDDELIKLYCCGSDINDIVIHQIIDSIHCYVYHTFDIGYRVRQNHIDENKENDDVKYNSQYIHSNKFMTAPDDNNDEQEAKNDDDNDPKLYSFGYRFFYWDYYKNNEELYDPVISLKEENDARQPNPGYKLCEWYIPPQFASFKDEMINNRICCISNKQWDVQYQKALIHLSSDYYKSFLCKATNLNSGKFSEEIYNIKYGCKLTVFHVLAMMFYCNYDFLQFKFSETFRRISPNESDKSLKQRHGNYHHFGRLLRELVDCFGTPRYTMKLPAFYHGISISFNFRSIMEAINGPLSTTTDYAVAAQFGKTGMILELHFTQGIGRDDVYYSFFECQYLSDYANEKETFFIGGWSVFKFSSIIEATTGLNYSYYVCAMGLITDRFASGKDIETYYLSGDCNVNSTIQRQMMFRMFSHLLHKLYPENKHYKPLLSMPDYVETLFMNHLANERRIDVNLTDDYGLSVMYDAQERKIDEIDRKIFHSFFVDDSGWLKLEETLKVFPSLTYLGLKIYEKLIEDGTAFLSVLSFLKEKKDLSLKRIQIGWWTDENSIACTDIKSLYEKQFEDVNWSIYTQQENSLYLYSNLESEHLMDDTQRHNKILFEY